MKDNSVITRFSRRFVNLKYLLPDKNGKEPTSEFARGITAENLELLESCRLMQSSLIGVFREREINWRYYFNDQFCEMIPDPDVPGTFISEKDYLERQGMAPISINLLRVNCKAILGMYTEEKMDPLVKARIREEQKLGEMLTIAMQHKYQSLNVYGTISRGYEEYLISSLPCFRVDWRWNELRKTNDVYIEKSDINRMFWDANTGGADQYFSPVTTIGYLHDMELAEVLAHFATTHKVRLQIEEECQYCRQKYPYNMGQQNDTDKNRFISFDAPLESNKIRVIEVWHREVHEVYICHDTARGIEYTLPYTAESEAEINAVNEKRRQDMIDNGGNPDDAAIIKPSYHCDRDWVQRFLLPNGYLLKQEINPHLHGSHPWVIGAFPLVDGKISSTVSDGRNAQRMINRTFIRDEWSEMNDSKGFTAVNKKVLDRSKVTIDVISSEYARTNGMVALEWKEGEEVFTRPESSRTRTPSESMARINFYAQVLDKALGTPGAVRGEEQKAGTPSSLYAQQTANANNNIADSVKWFNGLVEILDYKMLMLMLQHYDLNRWLSIVGDDYRNEIEHILNSEHRDILCDVSLIKSPSNGIARAETEDMLRLLYPQIGPEIYLETTSTHGADKVLEKLKTKQREMAEVQQQQAAALPPQQPV